MSFTSILVTLREQINYTTMKRTMFMLLLSGLLLSCQESLEDKCAREAKEYTEKKCPAPIGENIVIDSMSFERSTHTLHYYYSIKGAADSNPNINTSEAYNLLLSQIKNATSIKDYKDAGYNFAYTYRSGKDKNKVVFEAVFKPEDYK